MDGLPQLGGGLADAAVHDLLLERAEEALDHAIRLGLADEGVARDHAPEADLIPEVPGQKGAAVVVAECEAAGGTGADVAERVADRHADGLTGFEAIAALGDVQPSSSALQCSTTPNSQALPSCTVVIWVASVAHVRSGAAVMMRRSWAVSARLQARCGDKGACARISRSTRWRETRMPSVTRSRAQTFRCPSPVQGERARSARIAASSASSDTADFGPRRRAGTGGAAVSAFWRAA